VITQLKFAGIPTRDQTRALKFYTEQLGFEVSTDQPFDEKQRWIELRIANSATRVVLFTPEGHESRIGTFFNGSFACETFRRPTGSSAPAASSSCPHLKSNRGASSRSSRIPMATNLSCHLREAGDRRPHPVQSCRPYLKS
jgi:catechol 2,3-dioxygenase-like lactoylglutathione lyase family enzyme